MILLDTSGLLAALDESQRHHRECSAALREASPPRLLSPFVLAELDYLLMQHVGRGAQAALRDEVARGVLAGVPRRTRMERHWRSGATS